MYELPGPPLYHRILGIDFFDGSAQAAIAKMRDGGLLVVPAAPALKDLDRNTRWIMASPTSTKLNLEWLEEQGIAVPPDNVYMAPIYGETIDDAALLDHVNRIQPPHIIVTIVGGTP